MLVTVIAHFTAERTNSEKAIYLLSLLSCSTYKLKSHMFFTCKNCMFSDFMRKKNFAPENGASPPPPFSYGPVTAYLFVFDLFLTQWIMAILSKGCKPGNFKSRNSLKLSLWPSFEFCWMWIFLWIKLSWHFGSMWEKLG